MSREDFIPIKHGTIETEDGKTVEVGGGWFFKAPTEKMKEWYENDSYWNGTWGGSSYKERYMDISDTRWLLHLKQYYGGEFEKLNPDDFFRL